MAPAFEPLACLQGTWLAPPDVWLRAAIACALAMVSMAIAAQRFFAGQRAFVALLGALIAWVALTSFERSSQQFACRVSLALINWLAVVSVPVLWSLFTRQYVASDPASPPRRWWWAYAALLLVVGTGVVTNDRHGWMYGPASALMLDAEGQLQMRLQRGPMFWLIAAGAYAAVMGAILRVWQARVQATDAQRAQWDGFLIVSAVPLAVNMAYVLAGFRLAGSDPTPLSFAVAALGLGWLIRRNRLFDAVPFAQRLLLTELPDPVFILDAQGRVVEANAAARQLVAPAGAVPVLATPLSQWPRIGTLLAARLGSDGGEPDPSATAGPPLELSAPTVYLDLQVRVLGQGQRRIGTLVQLHDVTAREIERARVLRHLAAGDAEREALRDQALRDALTGLWNRRALEQRFEDAQAAPGHLALALVLADLDHFKRVNDLHGHATGDAVLVDFARRLRAAVRAGDTVARLGGEEFALLLPGADADDAARRVQALQEQLRQQPLAALPEAVSFSAGIATREQAPDTLAQLLAAADAALYAAKAAGRDTWRLAGPADPAADSGRLDPH